MASSLMREDCSSRTIEPEVSNQELRKNGECGDAADDCPQGLSIDPINPSSPMIPISPKNTPAEEPPSADHFPEDSDNQTQTSGELAYTPFPVECLPQTIKAFVVANAQAMGCDESFLALPALAVLAGAIGNSVRIRLKDSWSEPSILWTAVVADSGARKSPPFDAVTRPLQFMQMNANSKYERAMELYRHRLARYEQDRVHCIATGNEPPPMPEEPVGARLLVGDIAVEPLAVLLSRQWRGLLVCRDELDGWLGSFDAARAGKGAGPAHWLEFHGGRPMLIERRRGTPATIEITHASVSVTGGIQPEILASRLTKSHLASGLFARLLFAFPPPRSRRWSDVDVDQTLTERYSRVLCRLLMYPFRRDGSQKRQPEMVDLTPEARERFIEFVNEFGREQDDADEALAACFAKLEGYAARFALVLHMTRWAERQGNEENEIRPLVCDLMDIENGIKLSRWFAHETKRVRALLCETPEEADQRKLIAWLHRRGGQATARDLARSHKRRYGTVDEARAALNALAGAGIGMWVDRPAGDSGGRPRQEFILSSQPNFAGGFVGHDAPNHPIYEGATT